MSGDDGQLAEMPPELREFLARETEALAPVVHVLSDQLTEAVPPTWKRVRLVVSLADGMAVVERLDRPDDPGVVSPRMVATMAELSRQVVERGLDWDGLVIEATAQPDRSWMFGCEWSYLSKGPDATPLPPSFPTPTRLSEASRLRVETSVKRAELLLIAGTPKDALEALAAAIGELPGDALRWEEAGWVLNRIAGVRLGLGDAVGAQRAAQQALTCTGWQQDARALLRLGQAQLALGAPEARATLVEAARAGGAEWFARVAPDLMDVVRPR